MSLKIIFWLVVVLLLLLLVILTAFGFFVKTKEQRKVEYSRLNRLVYQDQFEELKRDLSLGQITQKQYDAGVEELERRILEESYEETYGRKNVNWAIYASFVILVVVPLFALSLYFWVGNPSLSDYSGEPTKQLNTPSEGATKEELLTFVKESPRDSRAWVMLSRIYSKEHNYKEALEAINKAFENSPNAKKDPGLLTERAVAMLETKDPVLVGQAQEQLDEALRVDPEYIPAKELSGMLAYQRQDYKRAVKEWSDILSILPTDSPRAAQLLDAIAEARNRDFMGFAQ